MIVPDDFRRRLGALLREYRVMDGSTGKFLAEEVGIHRSAIRNYESGVDSPSAYILLKLVDALEIDRAELLQTLAAGPKASFDSERKTNRESVKDDSSALKSMR